MFRSLGQCVAIINMGTEAGSDDPLTGEEEAAGGEGWDDFHMGILPGEEFIFSDELIIYTAARYRRNISDAPSTVYVITGE